MLTFKCFFLKQKKEGVAKEHQEGAKFEVNKIKRRIFNKRNKLFYR